MIQDVSDNPGMAAIITDLNRNSLIWPGMLAIEYIAEIDKSTVVLWRAGSDLKDHVIMVTRKDGSFRPQLRLRVIPPYTPAYEKNNLAPSVCGKDSQKIS